MTRKRLIPELKVVLDSSAIFTKIEHDLLRHEITQLIESNDEHTDVTILWYLPRIVISERQYQMIKSLDGLLRQVDKVERLLNHKLNITHEGLTTSVQDRIRDQIEKYNVNVLELAIDKVNWQNLITDALSRKPPFEDGEKEKGFRDALIVETFLQLVEASPKSRDRCWLVLLTGDNLLSEAVTSKTDAYPNVRVYKSIEDVKGLINTLVSTVDEAYVAELRTKAEKYFFQTDSKEGFVYKAKVTELISQQYANELASYPDGAARRENKSWLMGQTRFQKKEGKRLFWITRMSREAQAYSKSDEDPTKGEFTFFTSPALRERMTNLPPAATAPNVPLTWNISSIGPLTFPPLTMGGESEAASTGRYLPFGFGAAKLLKKGQSIFEIRWSVAVNPAKRLSSPKLEGIDYIETVWEPV